MQGLCTSCFSSQGNLGVGRAEEILAFFELYHTRPILFPPIDFPFSFSFLKQMRWIMVACCIFSLKVPDVYSIIYLNLIIIIIITYHHHLSSSSSCPGLVPPFAVPRTPLWPTADPINNTITVSHLNQSPARYFLAGPTQSLTCFNSHCTLHIHSILNPAKTRASLSHGRPHLGAPIIIRWLIAMTLWFSHGLICPSFSAQIPVHPALSVRPGVTSTRFPLRIAT